MPSPFNTAATGVLAALDAGAAESVAYKRPSTGQEITISAVPGETAHTELDNEGFPLKVRSQDWIFPADLLKLDGVNVSEPEVGDEVRRTDAEGTVHVNRLMPFGQPAKAWHYCDQGHTRLRIHTKRTGTE